MSKLRVGPLLGMESDVLYTVCFATAQSCAQCHVICGTQTLQCQAVGETFSTKVWRAEIAIQPTSQAQTLNYRIAVDGETATCQNDREGWTFYVPGISETTLLAYASCNGFSSADLMHKTKRPYELWERMQNQHDKVQPYSLLLMGGDQLYADEIWSAVPELKKWSELSHKNKLRRVTNKAMREQIDRFYEKLYEERWTNPAMSYLLASVPNVMIWDDHDIFDGWGSYPEDLQTQCDVYRQVFNTAKHYFELFQVRSRSNQSLLVDDGTFYSFGFAFRRYHVLALDNRAERTRQQIMSSVHWDKVNAHLSNIQTDKELLLLTAVPVVYRDFSFTETIFDHTPWEEELTDDLKDHWRAKEHQGERARLIHRLLDNAERRKGNCKTVLLSGDVHIGCIGVINKLDTGCRIHQVVSSGIVHPSPSRLQWLGIMAATNDNDEYLDEDRNIRISLLKPFSSDKYIRCRNYVTLKMGTDEKLWVNWETEGGDEPCYPIQ